MLDQNFRSGFISIIGRPNVGKSTFLNHIVGQKIAIMSDTAQTTRNKIQGVYTTDKEQIVFIDTPGIHKPHHKLGDLMVKSALSALNEVDAILFMIDATQKKGPGDNFIMDRLRTVSKVPIYLIINKIDLVHPDNLLGVVDDYKDDFEWMEVFPISASQGNNIDSLIKSLVKLLPVGPKYYPDDQVTDHPERFVISELIREKILQLTRQEVPHSVAVIVDKIDNQDDIVRIQATIIVERSTQKGIIIGKKGQLLKEIGQRARLDIETLLGSRVYLELWVKVSDGWRDKQNLLQSYGYRKNS